MKVTCKNFETGALTTKYTPFTPKQYLSINFAGWGFYKVVKLSALRYEVIDRFDGSTAYEINFSYS